MILGWIGTPHVWIGNERGVKRDEWRVDEGISLIGITSDVVTEQFKIYLKKYIIIWFGNKN